MINIIKADKSNIDKAYMIRLEAMCVINNLADDLQLSEDFKTNTMEYLSRQDQTTLLAINDKNEAVGCMTICYINIMPTVCHPSGKRAHLMNVYINKDYRRQGIAQKMLELLIDEARHRGVTEISLDATEMGKLLYKKCGFYKNEDGMLLRLNN